MNLRKLLKNMSYKLLDLQHKNEWKSLINRLPEEQQDIYYTPEYYELYEKNGDGHARCFVFSHGRNIALYPFLINSVNKLGYDLDDEYFDIQGGYGYNGPLVDCNDITFLTQFNSAFLNYCIKENIIAEFIRFNPVLKNHLYVNYLKPLNVNDNVLIDIRPDEEKIWMNSYESKVRKAIRKAMRFDLNYKIFKGSKLNSNWLNSFIKVYYVTLDKNKTDRYYYFNKNFYNNIVDLLGNNTIFFFVLRDSKVISVELVIHNYYTAYGFLGGTLPKYYYCNPNSYLRNELIKEMKKVGIRFYSIGGGKVRGDSIYKYKKSFARNIESLFYIGKKIHNKKVYDKVCSQWEVENSRKIKKFRNYLLKYRE